MRHPATHIRPARGKLGILLVGLGAVSTTFVAGVHAIRRGLAQPVGSLTQMGTLRLGARSEGRAPLIRDFVPLAGLDDLVFGAWDVFPDNAYESALKARVIEPALLQTLRSELEALRPWPGVFDPQCVKRLAATHVKPAASKRDLLSALRADIQAFKRETGVDRCVMLWCGSTECFTEVTSTHQDVAALERALDGNDEAIPPS